MSYRTIKKLLGETSLERKCRFLFGGGLMLLITISFYMYAKLNSRLVFEQNRTTAQLLESPVMLANHSKYITLDEEANDERLNKVTADFHKAVEQMRDSLKPDSGKTKERPEYSWSVVRADLHAADATSRPFDDDSYESLDKFRRDDDITYVIEIDRDEGKYHYYGALRAKQSCLACHNDSKRFPKLQQEVTEGDLLGMVKISFPLSRTERALAWNNAILLATAIVTAFLAMLAAYAIVRYVIVKPVLHLKDVSDEIAKGNLDLRADIRTGDEFEELSHAFNRMLRHLVTVQDELRNVNTNLDGKIDELAQVNLTLYEMNKLKDEFLATMSHELRTPLNSILGFSDVLESADNLTERQQKYLKNIRKSGKNLMTLINDLLDVAKIESGKMELHITENSLSDLVEQQVSSISPLSERKNIVLTSHVSSRIPLLQQDGKKLQQILNNLLSNAVKFTPEGGQVTVEAVPLGEEEFELTVEDTGVGIPLEDQESIFEKFRQGSTIPGQEETLTREYDGTGLGLSIVKELTKLLGGEVSLVSEFGKGSTFTVRLPVLLEPELDNRDQELPDRELSPDPLSESQRSYINRSRKGTDPDEDAA